MVKVQKFPTKESFLVFKVENIFWVLKFQKEFLEKN